MAILVGIDEAGYGPILGPLVVASAAFQVPDAALAEQVDLWNTLRRSVARTRSGSTGRVVIADSKKLHNRSSGYRALERGVLAAMAAGTTPVLPQSLADGLKALRAVEARSLADYPWYQGLDAHRLNCDLDDVRTAAAALARDLADHEMALEGLSARMLPVGRYNELVEAVDNKAAVLFTQVCTLIAQALDRFGAAGLQVVVDKQSGRAHYRRPLQTMFPDCRLRILREDDGLSSYQLTSGSRSFKVHFLVKGEQRQLPIALASMTAKYVRELCMERLNAWFRGHCPDLTPTAGYYTDGHRFLADLAAANLPEEILCRHLLVRCR